MLLSHCLWFPQSPQHPFLRQPLSKPILPHPPHPVALHAHPLVSKHLPFPIACSLHRPHSGLIHPVVLSFVARCVFASKLSLAALVAALCGSAMSRPRLDMVS